jgi:hypothetical protein
MVILRRDRHRLPDGALNSFLKSIFFTGSPPVLGSRFLRAEADAPPPGLRRRHQPAAGVEADLELGVMTLLL